MNEKIPATTDKLRIAIDHEAKGDKVDFPDPAGRTRNLWVGPVLYAGIALAVFCGLVMLATMASG